MTTSKQNAKKKPGGPGVISGTVDARAFTDRLELIARFMQRNTTIPILTCCAIEFDPVGFRLKLSHFGIDMTMQATMAGDGSGVAVVPVRSLLSFVAAADGDTLRIEKAEADDFVTFTCGRFTARLVPLPFEDVPRIDTPAVFARGFALGEGVMSHLLAMSAPFASTEGTRYYLNGVAFHLETDTVRAVATNGHMLGTRAAKTPAPLEAWDYVPIIPNACIAAIAGIIGKAQCTVRFNADFKPAKDVKGGGMSRAEWGHQRGQFDCDGWCITAKLIDGTYPDWKRVVPKPGPDAIKIDLKTADVTRFAKMAKGFWKGGAPMAVCPSSAESIRFSLRHGYHNPRIDGGDISGEIDAPEAPTEFQEFGINGFYLATIAKALASERMILERDNETLAPLVLRSGTGGDDFAVLMPMRV